MIGRVVLSLCCRSLASHLAPLASHLTPLPSHFPLRVADLQGVNVERQLALSRCARVHTSARAIKVLIHLCLSQPCSYEHHGTLSGGSGHALPRHACCCHSQPLWVVRGRARRRFLPRLCQGLCTTLTIHGRPTFDPPASLRRCSAQRMAATMTHTPRPITTRE
jgi:hypothetical protein